MKFPIVLFLFVGLGLNVQPVSKTKLTTDGAAVLKVAIDPVDKEVQHDKKPGGGYVEGSPLYPLQESIKNGTPPPSDADSLPISTTVKCIINLTIQFFIIYTALAIVRTINAFNKEHTSKLQIVCEHATKTVNYAPMLCALFLGTRMRAIQLAKGDTEKFDLPQDWVQNAMQVATWAVLAQALIVIVGTFLGALDDDDRAPRSSSNTGAVAVLEIAKYVTMLALYGGFTTVVVGAVWMPIPKELWGDKEPPVSPAVNNTINLGAQYFVVYLILVIFRTKNQLNKIPTSRDQEIFTFAVETVALAPMLCILFLAARQRALAIDPVNGNPQRWAQNCMFVCSYSVLLQTILVIIVPYLFGGDCKKGSVEGDVQFVVEDARMYNILTTVRWVLMALLYCGFSAIVVSVFTIEAKDGLPTPPISPALSNVLILVAQYFTIYLGLWVAVTYRQFFGGPKFLVEIFAAAKSTVMFCPMLSVLFVAARMRAEQLGRLSVPPFPGSPQTFAQDCMHLGTWALFVQLLMVIGVGAFSSRIETDKDGNVVSSGTGWSHKFMETIKYCCMLAIYGGSITVVYAILTMKSSNVDGGAGGLIPGVTIPAVAQVVPVTETAPTFF